MEKRPNFYIILELDPSITDWSTIEATIKNKHRSWAMQKNQGSPAARRKAERYMKFLPEMNALLKEPESRQKEAKSAAQEHKKEKQAQLEKLDQLIDMLHTATVSSKDVKLLINKSGKVFSEKEIEDRLKQRGISLDTVKHKKTARPKLETAVAKGIRGELDTLKLSSLYNFLNLEHSPKLSARSSHKSLYERADAIYKELSRVGKTDADTTLKMNLAGRAKSVFTNNTEKERYDNTLATEVLVELDNPLEIAGRDKIIDKVGLESLLKAAKKLGVAETIAREYIEDYAAKRKWGVHKETKTATLKLLTCGYCNTLAASQGDKRCRNCGEELVQPCPKCGAPTPTEDAACTRCGCHTGDAPLVKALLKEGKRLMAEGDLDQANSHFNRVLHYWADWQPALDEKKRLESKKRERTQALDKIKALVKARKLEAGKSQLERFNDEQAGTDAIKKLIDDGLRRAKQAYEVAEKLRLSGKTEEAFDKYEESLSHSVDFSPALSAMASSPPPPPQTLTAEWRGESLRLSWPKARGKISYRIVRKQGGLPANDRDGDIIAETSITKADDIKIKPGIAYYYGIFSVRAGVASPSFASTGPHLKTAEVEEIDYEVSNGQVTLKWRAPEGCIAVEVWRKDKIAPSRRGDGKQIASATASHLLDADLQNGRCYGYLIIAKYRHPEEVLYSKGVSILATPVAPPEPVKDLSANRHERTVLLTWTPGKAQVQIRQAQSIPDMTPGQIVSLKTAERFGVPIQVTSPGRAQTTLKTQGRMFFVPVSIVSETAVLGNPVTVTTIDEISQLVSQRNGRNIILTWQWPSGSSEVLVAYHHDHFPSSGAENGAAKARVTRSEYERNHYWELRSAAQQKHYFTVFVRDPTANIYSSGVKLLESMGQENIVRYQVVSKKKLFSKTPHTAWVEFMSEEGAPLAGLQVVRKAKYPPVSKNDGVIVAEVERITFTDKQSRIEIPKQYLKEGGYLKVFFKDDAFAKEVRLLPAAKDKLKI
ncbi:MAG: zinc ribbon domain-containing protein [Pseudomonadota bacterium]